MPRVGRRGRAFLAGAACAVLLAASAQTVRADTHKDEDLGYSVNVPRKWERMPVAVGTDNLIARFQCNREYEHSDPKTNFWTTHTPRLDVVIIPILEDASRGATVKKTDTGVEVTNESRVADLKEYLDDSLRGEGGFHFSAEDEVEIDGRKVIQYEVTIDKLVQVPKRVWAWAYYADDAIYGFIGDALIPHEDKIKDDVLAALKSVKIFPRKGTLPNVERTGADVLIDDPDETRNLTTEQIAERRDESFDRQLRRISDSLPRDWTVKETDRFAFVSHADSRFTKDVQKHCEAFRDWLDDTLGYIGAGHTGRVLIRVCADRDEYQSYQESRGWWRGDSFEVVTYKDTEGWLDSNWETLNRGIFDIWFRDKNRNLRYAAPAWIRNGLPDFLETARSKGRKIEFKADTWDSVQVDELRRGDKLLRADAFFSMTSEDLWTEWDNHTQAQFFIHFLLVGGAQKSSKYKRVFGDYLKNMIFLLDEAEADDEYKKLLEQNPETEEEETRLFRERQEFWEKQERKLLDRLKERTFEDWSDKDWDRFNSTYWKGI